MCQSVLLPSVFKMTNVKLETNPKMGPSKDEFEHLFNECVEEALTDLLGPKVREALLDHLERHDRFARDDLSGHPHQLASLLEKTFGKGGVTIGKYVIRKLHASLDWEYYENSHFDFELQLEKARTRWEKSQHATS
jgi:hypothetical protein